MNTAPPPPPTSLYIHSRHFKDESKRRNQGVENKNKGTAIGPVTASARAPSAHPLGGSGGGFQGSQRRRRKIEERGGGPPLNEQGELSFWTEKGPGRGLPAKPSGSRKRAPCVSPDLR